MNELIPQLDGDKERSKISLKKLRNKDTLTLNDKNDNYYNEEKELDTNLLAENCPLFIDFMPTKAVLDKHDIKRII